MKTTRTEENEITKNEDFQAGWDAAINNFSPYTSSIVDGAKNFIVTGTVAAPSTPGMSVNISKILGYDVATMELFAEENPASVSIEIAEATQGRIDIIQVQQLISDTNEQIRSFRIPNTITTQELPIKIEKTLTITAVAKKGTVGSVTAPTVDVGYVKIAEIVIPAAATTILTANIKNITAIYEGDDNTEWTADESSVYRVGSLNAIKELIRFYATNQDGGARIVYSTSARVANTKVVRDANMRFEVNTPVNPYDASTKGYADAIAAEEAAGVQAKLTEHEDDAGNPHGVTKDQVGLGSVTNASAAYSASPNTYMMRDSSGRCAVANPSGSGDCANKSYVDGEITGVVGDISGLQQYRTYETLTGKTWTGGQAIYRKCYASFPLILNIGSNRNIISMINSTYSTSFGQVITNYDQSSVGHNSPLYNISTGAVTMNASNVSAPSSSVVEYTY